MAKVILVSPSDDLDCSGDRPPLGILYIASSLRDSGHEVKIADMNHKSENELYTEVMKFIPNFVGISFTTPLFEEGNRLNKFIKDMHRNIKTIAGGPHPSADPESCKDFDYVIVGEGEQSILEVINEN